MVRLAGFEDLQAYIRQVLCARADLGHETPIVPTILRRGGRPCGVEFTLVAPRSVRLSAIWEAHANRVLFYDHNLERFLVNTISGVSLDHIPKCELTPAIASMWRGK